MSFEKQLRDALHQDSEQLVVVGTGTESVKRRAHRRRNRNRAGIATLTAAGVVGAAVAVTQLRPDEKATVAVQPAASKTMPDFAWRTVAGSVSSAGQVATAKGVTYVLGTAPGVSDPNTMSPDKSIYRSADGEHWTSQPLGANKWVSSLSEHDGVLYGVGTAPGTSDAIAVQLTTSDNEGGSWSPARKLPYEFARPAANIPLWSSASASGARGRNATVVIATAAFQPDLDSALHLDGSKSYKTTTEGVQILDMSKCDKAGVEGRIQAAGASGDPKAFVAMDCTEPPVLETRPWSDFGINDGGALRTSRVLVSADGSTWRDFPSPLAADAYGQAVHATSNGFLLSGTTFPQNGADPNVTRLFSSPDGEHWTELPALPVGYQVLDASGDALIAGNFGQSANVMVSTDAGVTWTSSPVGIAGAKGSYSVPSAGPLGIALVYPAYNAGTDSDLLLFSPDGVQWKQIKLGEAGAPKDGRVNNVRVGADHIEVVYAVNDTPGQKPDTLVTLLATPKAP